MAVISVLDMIALIGEAGRTLRTSGSAESCCDATKQSRNELNVVLDGCLSELETAAPVPWQAQRALENCHERLAIAIDSFASVRCGLQLASASTRNEAMPPPQCRRQ